MELNVRVTGVIAYIACFTLFMTIGYALKNPNWANTTDLTWLFYVPAGFITYYVSSYANNHHG